MVVWSCPPVKDINLVPRNLVIDTAEQEGFFKRLGDQYAIEGIAMVVGKLCDLEGV